jgi:type VI secretion system protein ImpL
MTTPTDNIKALALSDSPSTESTTIATWGPVLASSLLAGLAFVLVWLNGDLVNILTEDAKKTAAIWILGTLALVLILHMLALSSGAYRVAGRLFRLEVGKQTAQDKMTVSLKRDPRLHYLCDELRITHGWRWRWRYRLPWLLVTGSDTLVEEVAPGLKQAGVLHTADTILVHAAPDGIDAAVWRKQIRQMRHKRPVDGVVQVVRTGDGIRPDADLPRTLATLAADLGWAASVTFLHAVRATGTQPEMFEPIGVFASSTVHRPARGSVHSSAEELRDDLTTLELRTGTLGVRRCFEPNPMPYLAQVSAYIGAQRERIVTGWEAMLASKWLRAPLEGVMFAPVFVASPPDAAPLPIASTVAAEPGAFGIALRPQPASLLPTWQQIGRSASGHHGRRVGFYWPNALAAIVMVLTIAWCVAMAVSFIGNHRLIRDAQASADAALAAAPGTPAALRAQLALQQRIEVLEYRRQHGAPWRLRAGLNHNDTLLDSLWRPYRAVAERNLQRPVVQALQRSLTALAQVRADALQSHDAQQRGYQALKAYRMLAEPQRTDAAFLAKQLVVAWPAPARMRTGEWLDTSQRLAAFYAAHLKAHPAWRINPSAAIVTAARTTLVNQIGLANADDAVYQQILDDAQGKYADASLATLLNGADARGLFTTAQTVPGLYTRAAWEGVIAAAIDKAAGERQLNSDWVLSDAGPAPPLSATVAHGAVNAARTPTPDGRRPADDGYDLQARLTARYFADYTGAWQGMLNSIQWQPAANLNGAIDQLTRLTDAQTSPLIALMKSVQYQAQAGRPSQAFTDTLVRKAQSLIGSDAKAPAPIAVPLDKPFGPLLALVGDTGGVGSGSSGAGNNGSNNGAANVPTTLAGVSLAHYLTVATTMRLKLQQIAASPDAQAMARALAQAVFQGKLSELAQAHDDAALTAASLGTQWAGFGDALFARPLDTAWQTILQPAAASLNEAWRASVATPFRTAFTGRYPFFESSADASFAELGRYVRPDTGLIARFMTTQLAGVLKPQGDQWVPNELAPQALQFDPAFLTALRQLATLGIQLYAQGDAGYRFELMALPTENVTRSELTVDDRQIVYFNQREAYTPLAWPGNGLNGHAGLTWQTVNAGMRQAFDATGDWSFLRLLAQAEVKPLDSTRYELTWNEGHGEPLRYVLRTQLGAGPLDLLRLRGFRMPERIFLQKALPSVAAGKTGTVRTDGSVLESSVLPPLPPELQ